MSPNLSALLKCAAPAVPIGRQNVVDALRRKMALDMEHFAT
jgi:hypothetical protein